MSFPPSSPLYLSPDGSPVIGRTAVVPKPEIEIERVRPAIKHASSKEDDYKAALVEIRTLIQDYQGSQAQIDGDSEELESEIESIISQAIDRG